ncbi:unnamed protein product [Lepeophtheirus salmonis]|uniref:(salmon louse) hypothetical protein n=1 Tax=Lepeophtheirus salmonis TaxID=72036 RepID=A0A7R8CDG2_LEPSM|nr:unnamed protein product [Lepeophtheirus salmonis]CAF2780925.1 unnamed protein product [Lepeophtheirus salmonis]
MNVGNSVGGKGMSRKRRKYVSLRARLLAPSHIFYIKGSSKMFFLEVKVTEVLKTDWKEKLLGSRVIIIFPVEPSLPKDLRFMQNDPHLGLTYEITHLVKASLSLTSFQDIFSVFKITPDTKCEIISFPDAGSSMNESTITTTLNHNVAFSYKGIVTDDSFASSGVYILDKIVKLVATNLCVVTNVRLFKKGMTLEIFNSHYHGPESVIFLCARSFVKSHHYSNETSVHSKTSVDVYKEDPIVDLALDFNLGLRNIFTTLGSCLQISEFHTEYRSLVKEYFSTDEEHKSCCVIDVDLFQNNLIKPFKSIKAFKESFLSQFPTKKTVETESNKWIRWGSDVIEVNPKIKGPLVGKLIMDKNTGRYILKDNTESIPLILMEDEEPHHIGYLDLVINSLVILCEFNYYLVFEKSTNWNKIHAIDTNPELMDNEWIVIRCSPPTRNISSSISTPLEFIVEGKSKYSEKTEYLTIPCKDYIYLRPGTKIYHFKDFIDTKKEYYRLYFIKANRSILCDPQIDIKLFKNCLASHKITEIMANAPISGINFKCIVVNRWLYKSADKSKGSSYKDQCLTTLEPTEFGFVNCHSLQLVVAEDNTNEPLYNISFKNREKRSLSPWNSSWDASCCHIFGGGFVFRVINAFVDKFKKLTMTAYCLSCNTALSPGGCCPYVGCHATTPSNYVKVYSIFELSDESGEIVAVVSNTRETLQILLSLGDKEWDALMKVVIQIGYFTYTYKGFRQLPYTKFHEDALSEDCGKEMESYINYFYVLTEFHRLRYSKLKCIHQFGHQNAFILCALFDEKESNSIEDNENLLCEDCHVEYDSDADFIKSTTSSDYLSWLNILKYSSICLGIAFILGITIFIHFNQFNRILLVMSDVDSIVKKWSDLYSEEVLEFARPAEVSNEEVFRGKDKIDKNVQILSKSNVNDAQNREYLESRLASDLSNIRDTQYREFREWVMRVHEEFQRGDESNGNSELARSQSSFSIEASPSAPRLQESFTITLGAQMKQMHNLRLVAADVLDLCRYPAIPKDDSSSSLPQRLQTSMSLYSNNICGVVLLDNKDLDALLNRSNEYHFANYEQQLESIMSSDVKGKSLAWQLDDPCLELKSGDFYVTRHSNLCEVHVLFHMITDESILSGSINSRHPAVMGLRNVLKTASLSDVTTVTIPLLLASEMHEIMTVAWCMKRAELVFKCVKGFMMEVASWGGSDIKTLQFLVPKDIDEDVFNRLTSMLAGIFSNI